MSWDAPFAPPYTTVRPVTLRWGDRRGRPPQVGPRCRRSAGGLPPRAPLRLRLGLDRRCRNAQRGRGCVVAVVVGLADLCGDTAAGGHLEAVGSRPLADPCGFVAVRRGTGGRRAPSTLRWRTSGPSSRCHIRSEGFPKLRSVGLAQINLVVLAFEVKSHGFVGFAAVDVIDEPDLGHACHTEHFHSSRCRRGCCRVSTLDRECQIEEHSNLWQIPAANVATDFMRLAARRGWVEGRTLD